MTVPRIVSHAITSAGAGAGETEIIVPGIYAALLAHERGKYEDPHYWDPRRMKQRHPGGGYCTSPGAECKHEPPPQHRRASREPLDALDAGQPVVVARKYLGGDHISGKHWPGPPPDLPWDRGVRTVRITPDDRVTPTTD